MVFTSTSGGPTSPAFRPIYIAPLTAAAASLTRKAITPAIEHVFWTERANGIHQHVRGPDLTGVPADLYRSAHRGCSVADQEGDHAGDRARLLDGTRQWYSPARQGARPHRRSGR